MSSEQKRIDLIQTASVFIGVHADSSGRQGDIIHDFEQAVGQWAKDRSWCLSFQMYCIRLVDQTFEKKHGYRWANSVLPMTAGVMDLWHRSPDLAKIKDPIPGCLVLWEEWKFNLPTGLGHAGLVKSIGQDGTMVSIEGNTSDKNEIDRSGNGVFEKTRHIKIEDGPMRTIGFINPWP